MTKEKLTLNIYIKNKLIYTRGNNIKLNDNKHIINCSNKTMMKENESNCAMCCILL